ncbi:MAG: class I SAM-dependent methyltransferase, partial [Acidobacteria bacterium]|nr:class I SAM-dependent methyltransferase [Acidobacteriota bacterium]
ARKFDLVISSAVLHFARDEQHFQKMVNEMWRVLKPGGLFLRGWQVQSGLSSWSSR